MSWLRKPEIIDCKVASSFYQSQLTPVVIHMHGWGRLRVTLRDAPSPIKRFLKNLCWPLFGKLTSAPICYTVKVKEGVQQVKLVAPAGAEMSVCFFNLFGFTRRYFSVPMSDSKLELAKVSVRLKHIPRPSLRGDFNIKKGCK
ncbi:MAG: hypothetical protein Q9M31_00875 [Mariprofundus sp.]|nr:hypothetical protein [Mariprofundus sp.]